MLSLKNTSLVAFAAIVAIPLAVFWAWPRPADLDANVQQVAETNLQLARTIGASLDFYNSEIVKAFERTIEDVETGNTQILNNGLVFCYIAWVDSTTGKVTRKAGFRSELVPDQLSASELSDLKSKIEYGKTSPARLNFRAGEPTELRLARARQGMIVFANFTTGRVASLVRAIETANEIQITVIDQNNRVIASSNAGWQKSATDLSTLGFAPRGSSGEHSLEKIIMPGTGDATIASTVPVASSGWNVIVHVPLSQLQVSASGDGPDLELVVLCILIAALIGSTAAAPIVAPLMDVIRAARRMQAGETEIRIPLLSRFAPTELVELSRAFNGMAESVANARLQEAEARSNAERASQSKTEFLRNVTHEVRTPLNAIIGFSEVLLNECRRMNLPQRQVSHAEDICSAGRHMLGLINSLLDLSRIEAGQYQLNEAPTAIDEVVTRCVRFLGPAAQARNTRIETQIDPQLPDVVADERALFQSVLNLTANAIRYGREGGRVTICAVPSRLHGVEIAICDDGPGIPAEYLDKVMEPFVRVASEANRNIEGSGLGLPIVKKLIELHGGSFVLESTFGAGTTARIRLPSSRLLPRNEFSTSAGQAAA